jgi:hypothetical protein
MFFFLQDEKMFSIVQELMRTRRELREVKDQLHTVIYS